MAKLSVFLTIIGLVISAMLPTSGMPTLADGVQPTVAVQPQQIQVNISASVSSAGAGEARAQAQIIGGQANAEIVSAGAGKGEAYANAPVCQQCQQPTQPDQVSQAIINPPPTAALQPAAITASAPPTPVQSAPANLLPTVTPLPLAQQPTPQVQIAFDLVNVRQAPNPAAPITRIATKGQIVTRLETTTNGEWIRIGPNEWIAQRLVQPITASSPTLVSTDLAMTIATPAGSPEPAEGYPFLLEFAERHSESNNVTLYAYIHENERPLDGHYLTVTVNGAAAPGLPGAPFGARSADLPLGTTRPACDGVIFDAAVCAQNRIFNLKQAWDTRLMYPTFSPWGAWKIQLVNGAGHPIGPSATFDLRQGQTDLELYVRYKKR